MTGEKLAIVTHKPQTTRTRILGVVETPVRAKTPGKPGRQPAQIVFVDTPGVHKPETQLDKRMMQEVYDALESRDLVLLIVDATHRLPRAEKTGEAKPFTKSRQEMSKAEDDFVLQLVKKIECPGFSAVEQDRRRARGGPAAADRALVVVA